MWFSLELAGCGTGQGRKPNREDTHVTPTAQSYGGIFSNEASSFLTTLAWVNKLACEKKKQTRQDKLSQFMG